jgi:hypothetical protein
MAVFLNPHYRQMWFEDHWQPAFVNYAMTKIKEQYHAAERFYNIDAQSSSISPTQPRKELTGFAAYNKRSSRKKQPSDELARYMAAAELPDDADPLQWWLLHQEHYPVSKHLVFTSLAAPASTAADERLFSMAGNVVNERRPHT